MPRRSGHGSDESPAQRRTSARIAAVQAASPAKSPAKSPKRKRQSTERTKTQSEDTESQQSQIKSESSVEELNGLETSSTKDRDSAADSQELSPKKAKIDRKVEDLKPEIVAEALELTKEDPSTLKTTTKEVSEPIADFEVVEKSEVPAPDSAEVNAAISAQGEDGQLLVGFMQVDKDELPSATSIEVKEVTPVDEPQNEIAESIEESVPTVPAINSMNGDVHNHSDLSVDTPAAADCNDFDIQTKMCPTSEITPPIHEPAAGDAALENVETVSQ